jgi:pimeloyl-ACP methyl ester carboxylesterase
MTLSHVLGELVTFDSTTGMHLDGILYQKEANDTTIVHVHGSFGNFYANQWLRVMAKLYGESGINFLSFNLTAHDGIVESYRTMGDNRLDDFAYSGFSIVNFETCIEDIQGAINFVHPFSKRIILQGHSLGCDRVLYYLISQKANYDFILIGPADSYQLHENLLKPETIDHQIERLKARPTLPDNYDWLPLHEYGIKQPPREVYCIPITRDALLSIVQGPPFKIIRIISPARFYLAQGAAIYMGGKDGFQTWSPEVMYKFFEEHIQDVTRIYRPENDHELKGCEVDVTEQIIKWVKSTKKIGQM